MKKLLNPKWLLLILTLPQIFVFTLYWKILGLVKSQLGPGNIEVWEKFALALAALIIGFTAYAVYLWVQKKEINPRLGIFILATYISYLFVYFTHYQMVIPDSIPRWMLLGMKPELTTLTLIVPSLAYAMMLLEYWLTPMDREQRLRTNVYYMLGVPLFWIFSLIFIIPLIEFLNSSYYGTYSDEIAQSIMNFLAFMMVVSTFVFMFFTVRFIYVLLHKRPELWKKLLIPVVIVMPSLGLFLLNSANKVIGDFSGVGFYVLTILTGALIVVPTPQKKNPRLALFIGKCLTLPFSLYLFVVFLPYLPLSIPLIFCAGMGFLLLGPMVLAAAHLKSLWLDYKILLGNWKKQVLWSVLIAGLLVLPCLVVITMENDRANLDTALKFIYNRSLSDKAQYHFNLKAIARTFDNVNQMRNETDEGLLDTYQGKVPYLTGLYNWLVLDNLTLANSKASLLKRVLWFDPSAQFAPGSVPAATSGEGSSDSDWDDSDWEDHWWTTSEKPGEFYNAGVVIEGVKTESYYDSAQKTYHCWVHLNLKNTNDFPNVGYRTVFTLPEGVYISNYYLNVDGVKKVGLLSEKRAAEWIFQQIVGDRRDPGLLSYQKGNRVALRVFPFSENEERQTGFELIYRRPVTLTIDSNTVALKADPDAALDEPLKIGEDVLYVSSAAKGKLPAIARSPEYHFIMDYSDGNAKAHSEYFERIKAFIREKKLPLSQVEISAVNYNMKTVSGKGPWERELGTFRVEGGFYLERVIDQVLYDNYRTKSMRYPVFIVVTNHFEKAVLTDSLVNLRMLFPESSLYYQLDQSGNLYAHSFLDSVLTHKVSHIKTSKVLAWPDAHKPLAYLKNDREDSLVLLRDDMNRLKNDFSKTSWENGVMLQAMVLDRALHPERDYEKSAAVIRASFKSKTMTPLTSYIVLENEAQERVLLEKQRTILGEKRALDATRTVMDEPSPWWLLILALVMAAAVKIKRKLFTSRYNWKSPQ